MPNLGPVELIIILVIVLVIFGAGRLTDIMGALGRGVAEFRKGTEASSKDETKQEEPKAETPKSV